ncbi:MAG: PEP-CTERM sorting domain-containing protein [Planctomycetes bacterium]|nr:PEP-CTERM sorting domain-containing protein [Planctomycetota bacterium]
MTVSKSLRFVGAVLCLCLFTITANAATDVIHGSVFEFGSPDDLDLNQVVIAVGVFNESDKDVNGVMFRTAGQAGGSGTATEGGVTATITAANQINNWAAAPPAFTGGTPGSAANLGEIMQDIRWAAAPNPITVLIEGLNPGSLYKLQLLTNEGADRTRHWDVGVSDGAVAAIDNLVVDNISSEGDNTIPGVWTADNSFGYEGQFVASAAGTLTAIMQQEIPGGLPQEGGDNNPILQAVVVNATIPEPSTLVLAALGLLTLAGSRFRRRRR